MAKRKHKKSGGRTAWRKKFGKAASQCHSETTSPKTFGKCMSKKLK